MTSPSRFTRLQIAAFMLAFLLIIASLVSGPYFAASQSEQNQQQIQKLTAADQGIQQLLDFVAKVSSQGGGGATTTEWYISEIQAICQAMPGCKDVPLPAGVPGPQLPRPTPTTVPKG